ncbi:MAG: excinuclease ABC subunit UvrB [Candidatus Neomarinimicrobiota bacterium]
MAEFQIHSDFSPSGDQPKAIRELSSGIRNDVRHQTLLGTTGSGKTFTVAKVIEAVQKPTLIMSHNKTLAAQLYGEFKQLFPQNAVEYFISYYDYYQPEAYLPVTDTFIEKDFSMNDEIDKLRLRATSSLLERNDVIVVSSVSCIFGIGSPTDYKREVIHILKGKTFDRRELFKHLVNIHYLRNDLVLERGNFRVRGDVLEISPAYEDACVRIELFGDDIESIVTFDPITGEVIRELDSLFIYPAKHFVSDQGTINHAIKGIQIELISRVEELREEGKLLEAQRIEQRTNFDLEMLREVGYCSGIENYSRYLAHREPGERPWTLIDFFPADFLTVIDESHVSLPQIRGMYNGDRKRKQTLVEYGFRLPSALDNRPLKYDEFMSIQKQIIYASATPAEEELNLSGGVIVEQIIRPTGLVDPMVVVRKTKGQIEDLIGEIQARAKKQERTLVTTLTKRMSEDLAEYLSGLNLRVRYLHSEIRSIERVKILRDLRLGEFDVLIGINLLREGLDLPEVSLVAVLDADKQGFLRSKSSLMQVAGRAARNVNGSVILYGDTISKAMEYLIVESGRRRQIQVKYNRKHNIQPTTIYKSSDTIMQTTAVADSYKEYVPGYGKNVRLEEFDLLDKQLALDMMRQEMLNEAENLKFEQAALLRDEIEKLEKELKTSVK